MKTTHKSVSTDLDSGCSADCQSAVSPIGNRQALRTGPAWVSGSAPAIANQKSQIANRSAGVLACGFQRRPAARTSKKNPNVSEPAKIYPNLLKPNKNAPLMNVKIFEDFFDFVTRSGPFEALIHSEKRN